MKGTRSRVLKYLAIFVFAIFVAVCGNVKNVTALAAYAGNPSELAQQGLDKTSIPLTWKAGHNATSYNVYYKLSADYSGEYKMFSSVAETSCTITGLVPGQMYTVKVESSNEGAVGGSSYLYDAVTQIDTLKGLKQSKWWFYLKQVEVEWDKCQAADGYEYVFSDDKNKKISQGEVKSPNCSFKGLKDKVYTLKVRAYMEYGGQKYYTPWASIKCLNQARMTSVKVKGNSL